MLLVQEIELYWEKTERNAKSAKVRNQFPMAYLLPETNKYDNVILYHKHFRQHNTTISDCFQPKRQFYCYSSIEKLHIPSVSICQNEYKYEISFFYSGSTPIIRGHNKDYNNPHSQLYRKDYLNEVAFTLKQNQYGRIIWNARTMYFDSGEWYYILHIYNFYVTDKMPQRNIFISNTPDFIYKQMSMLF